STGHATGAGLDTTHNLNANNATRDKKRPPPKSKAVRATYGANRRLAWSKEDFTQYSKIGSILLSLVRRRGGRKVSPGYCQTSPPDVKDVRILLEMWVGFGIRGPIDPPQLIDFIKRENRQNRRMRPSRVHME